MAVKAVVFDVGETLIDESRDVGACADVAGVPRFTLMGVLGGLARAASTTVGPGRSSGSSAASAWIEDDFYPDALPCLERLRSAGLRVGAVGNTPAAAEALLRDHVDLVGSSGRWGIEKPSPPSSSGSLLRRRRRAEELAYVGDRVDNDIEPALAAGMSAIHVRRGPWGRLQEPPAAAIRIRSLESCPGVGG